MNTANNDTELEAICAQFKSKIAINDLDGKILFISHEKITNNDVDDLDTICLKFGNSFKIVSGEEFRDIVRNKTHFLHALQRIDGKNRSIGQMEGKKLMDV